MTFEEETCGDNVARGKSGKEVMEARIGNCYKDDGYNL